MSAAEAAAAESTRRFRVFRFKRGDAASRFDDFDVPDGAITTVLEALRWIQVHEDRSLGIRHSCFHASCGTCGVRVNGREGLACVTQLSALGRTVTVEPIANLPILNDLVVDMASFTDRFIDPHSIVRDSEFLEGSIVADGIDHHERFEDCIECGLCLSACPVAATDDTYVGPAALAYAQRMLEVSREGDGGADAERQREAILNWADGDNAAWRCHAAFECTEACPSNVRPAQRIMSLRRELRNRKEVSS
jgi:succinate dehydrogenase / fumarate reductase iron-sulfur subunit